MLQVATGSTVYVFHVLRFDEWREGSSGKALRPLQDLLKSRHIIKYGVNIKNDVEMLHACNPGLQLPQCRCSFYTNNKQYPQILGLLHMCMHS